MGSAVSIWAADISVRAEAADSNLSNRYYYLAAYERLHARDSYGGEVDLFVELRCEKDGQPRGWPTEYYQVFRHRRMAT
jgi:hypothetical protein